MSFDVSLVVPGCTYCGRGKSAVYAFNLTHNVNEIVDRCLFVGGATSARGAANQRSCYADRSWGRLAGWTGAEAAVILNAALRVAYASDREAEFRALEPGNEWGSLESVRRVMTEFHHACEEHPKTIVEAHG